MICKRGTIYYQITVTAFLFYALIMVCEIYVQVKNPEAIQVTADQGDSDFIKWVDFNVSYEALCLAYEYDVATYGQEVHLNWIELLAYSAAKNGGDFGRNDLQTIRTLAAELQSGESTIKELTQEMNYFDYYKEAYSAVLADYVGKYRIQVTDEHGSAKWEEGYGLRCFSPIAKTFPYSDYDDFGSSRSYGYARRHLGHDMVGQTGTPIIAIESGTVEALGWNQYGGWRIGIRSADTKRYYYYAHLRQNRPYAEGLEEGDTVTAGEVIGYMGHTGYSTEENVNNIKVTHLHWGLQLIFDESQKDGNGEIWVDCYALTRFLYKNRAEVVRDDATKEWSRVVQMEWL